MRIDHFDYIRHHLERNLRGDTLTMDQARQLAEIIVMCTQRRHAPNCQCSECCIDLSIYRQSPFTSEAIKELQEWLSSKKGVSAKQISQGELTIESRNALLPKPK